MFSQNKLLISYYIFYLIINISEWKTQSATHNCHCYPCGCKTQTHSILFNTPSLKLRSKYCSMQERFLFFLRGRGGVGWVAKIFITTMSLQGRKSMLKYRRDNFTEYELYVMKYILFAACTSSHESLLGEKAGLDARHPPPWKIPQHFLHIGGFLQISKVYLCGAIG